MSLPEMHVPRRPIAAISLLCLALAGCFRPIYAELPTGGTIRDSLAAVDVATIIDRSGQERIGHYLRNELAFDLDGSGQPRPKRYKLEMTVTERLSTTVVNTQTGRADAAVLIVDADFTLKPLDGSPILAAKATASASYDRGPQRFASVRAARDAELRAAKLLGEQIQTRIAATLAARAATPPPAS
jgi:LPS-assembly lipoprotein